jgi:uncharacterized membrane protein YoaK (UPF0700 family)
MTNHHTADAYSGRPHWLRTLAIILAFAAGATDAFAFLQLSGVFTANMTGNLVLVGLTERSGYADSVAGIVVAIFVFILILFAAFRFTPAGSHHVRLASVLAVALLSQSALLLGWAVLPDRKIQLAIVLLIGMSATAMACQTAVAKRIDGASGVTTTYVTGTLTSVMADAADRKPQALSTRLGVVVALVAGALCSSLLAGIAPVLAAALPVFPAAAGVVVFSLSRADARESVVTQ